MSPRRSHAGSISTDPYSKIPLHFKPVTGPSIEHTPVVETSVELADGRKMITLLYAACLPLDFLKCSPAKIWDPIHLNIGFPIRKPPLHDS